MKKINIIFYKATMLTICVSSLILLTRCGAKTDSSMDDTLKQPVDTTAVDSPTDNKPVENVLVYFDNSNSMEGYVSKGAISKNNKFLNAINALGQDFISKDKFSARFCCVEKGQKRVRTGIGFDAFTEMIQKGNIAKGEDSPLDKILGNIASNSREGTLSVLFTDGILSGTNEQINTSPDRKYNIINIEVLKSALRSQLKGKNVAVSVYHFKDAAFVGQYWTYKNISIPKKATRPLYAIVLGSKDNVSQFKNWVESSANTNFKPDNVLHIAQALPIQEGLLNKTYGIKDGVLTAKDADVKKKLKGVIELRLPTSTFEGVYEKGFDYHGLANELNIKLNGEQVPKSFNLNGEEVETITFDKDVFTIKLPVQRLQKSNTFQVTIPYTVPMWISSAATADDIEKYSDATTFMIDKFIGGILEGVSKGKTVETLFDQKIQINIKK